MVKFVPVDEQEHPNVTAFKRNTPEAEVQPGSDLHNFLTTGSPGGHDDPEVGPKGAGIKFVEETPKYDAHVFGQSVPALQPVVDLAAGFNEMLATLGGIAMDDMDIIMRDLGTSGFLETPGDGTKIIQEKMEAAGMAADSKKAVSEFLAKIGNATAQQTLMLGALFAAAPIMAAAQGTSVLGLIQRDLGKFLIQHPLATVSAEGGAIVGGQVGQEHGGTPGAVLGSMIGGGLAGSPTLIEAGKGAVRGAVKATVPAASVGAAIGGAEGGAIGGALAAPIGATAGAVRGATTGRGMRAANKGVPNTPMVPAPQTAERLKPFAQEAIEGDTLKIDNAIVAEINKVKKIADPLRAAEVLRANLGKAFRVARTKESDLWSKVNLKQPMTVKPLSAFARNMRASNSRFAPDSIPSTYLARIGSMAKSKKPITIGDFRAMRGEILAELRQHIPNDKLRRNLKLLSDELLNEIEKAYPNDKAMQTASNFSRWTHNRFSRGPVGQFIRRESGRPMTGGDELGDMMDPGRGVEALLRREKSGKAIRNISQTLNMPQLKADAASWIENEFRRQAEGLDARSAGQGRKWLNRPETKRFIKAFPELSAKMQGTYARLGELLDEREIIEKSAFKKFSLEDPQTAIARVFNSKNKVGAAKELRARFSDDPEALAAWKSGIVEELFRSPNWNPKTIQARLNTRDMREFMQEALGHETAVRLYRNVNDAARLYKGEQVGMGRAMFNRGTTIFGRIVAAKVGNRLGGGDIQTPGLLSAAAGKTVDNLLKLVPPETLLARAMTDPKWEKVLYSRVPRNLHEMEKVEREVSRLVSGMEASRNAVLGTMEPEGLDK